MGTSTLVDPGRLAWEHYLSGLLSPCEQQQVTAIAAGHCPQAVHFGDPNVVTRLTDLPVPVCNEPGGPGQCDIFLVSKLGENVWL